MIELTTRFNSLSDILSYHIAHWNSYDALHYAINTIIAALLGWLIGFNHEKPKIKIGARTFSAVAIGTSLASGCLMHLAHLFHSTSMPAVDNIMTGMGFIAGAVIIRTHDDSVYGLTSAASLWATGIVGLAVGLEFYATAILAAIILTSFLWLTRHADE